MNLDTSSFRLALGALTTRPHAPWLLDLFCGAGGAAMGYWQAGFNIVGIDRIDQPHYPFWFIRADAMEFARHFGASFDVIHASPPCQEYSQTRYLRDANASILNYISNVQAKLIGEILPLLNSLHKPWVIENVVNSPLPSAVQLCGSMFGLLLRRHRWFESSHLLFAPGPCRHTTGFYGLVGGKVRGYGDFTSGKTYLSATGEVRKRESYPPKQKGVDAMGIDWMTIPEMSEAIPPAYTRYIGEQMMRIVRALEKSKSAAYDLEQAVGC